MRIARDDGPFGRDIRVFPGKASTVGGFVKEGFIRASSSMTVTMAPSFARAVRYNERTYCGRWVLPNSPRLGDAIVGTARYSS